MFPLIHDSNLLLQYLLHGDMIGLVIAVYTSTMGEWFFGAVMLIVSVPLYIRTQSVTYCVVLWLVCSGMLMVIVPFQFQKVISLFIILTVAGIIYSLIKSRTP